MDPCTVLAHIPRKGCVRVCPTGCVHVTFCGVTLDFTQAGFEGFSKGLESRAAPYRFGEMEVECFHVRMRLSSEDYGEFLRLLAAGRQRLALWCEGRDAPPKQPLSDVQRFFGREDFFSES